MEPHERVPLDPNPTPETEAFWEAAKAGRFLVRHCNACSKAHWYPRGLCPFCASTDTAWRESSGMGEIYSFSFMRKATPPFVMAYVTLAEGPTMMTNIVACDPENVHIGDPVEVAFRNSAGGFAVPCFRPAGK